ncbi:ring-cleaving dioxygenase [Halogeometricum borinquense]|uniref:Ring-cleaving dioxygenase n=1 Tax=Halogeometricum borinquense TaxID=60847 RepID=A0A482TRA3_9EURY|nr:ring-cleaving dioxygenase [Halogeometricum borinquense]RYJ15415.1 ring-cleaving dioxygenase [Halogeometricum borinquense]
MNTTGIHHVTAIADDPNENVRFYTDVLGLRLVKRTVNFDDPHTYHLYYGDETGSPGTALTFFPFGEGRSGRPGRGQAVATSFAVPEGSLDYWRERFADHDVTVGEVEDRFGAEVLPFEDDDGQPLELIEGKTDIEPWVGGPVPEAAAIRGFFGVTLQSKAPDATGRVLELLGFERGDEADDRVRYVAHGDRATVVDLLKREPPRGRPGTGTVHHVAFRAPDTETQMEWREKLTAAGQYVTQQKDRQYFESIYFREPGGVLFEIATDGPGFTADESVESLGSELKLPSWLADDREEIAAHLPPLDAVAGEVSN